MLKIAFILPPQKYQVKNLPVTYPYGVSRLIYKLVNDTKIDQSLIGSYDFSMVSLKDFSCTTALIEKLVRQIKKSHYFGFSVLDNTFSPALRMAKELKKKNPKSKVIFGGCAATELADEILEIYPFVDYVGVSMGEDVVDGLLSGAELSEIPNLIWRRHGKIFKNKIVFPSKSWEKIRVANAKWLFPEGLDFAYEDNVLQVISALGCFKKCSFCHIIKKEPQYIPRPIECVVDELNFQADLKKNMTDHYDVFFIDENILPKLGKILASLKQDVVKKISSVVFDCRADALLGGIENLIKVLCKYPFVKFNMHVGFESFSDAILNELNKECSSQQVSGAAEEIIKLLRQYDNFIVHPSFITFTPWTKIEDLVIQVKQFKKYFLKMHIHPRLFLNILMLGCFLDNKYNFKRKKGWQVPDNFNSMKKGGRFGYPLDKKTRCVVKRFYNSLLKMPSYDERMLCFGNDISDQEYENAEIYLLERILDRKGLGVFIKDINNKFKYYKNKSHVSG